MSAMHQLLAKSGRPVVQRQVVAHLQAKMGLSERRACRIVGVDRKMIRYQSQPAPDIALRTRLRDLAMNAGGSVAGGCSFRCGGRASRPGSTAFTGCIVKRA